MKFVSTRGGGDPVSLSEAILNGVAPDGGLYLPDAIPVADLSQLTPDLSLADFATRLLAPFFAGDRLEGELAAICGEAYDFDVPLVDAVPGLKSLELFHGPTGAFKDFGARFLMGCFDRLGDKARPLTVLAATSGDTGGAVGRAAEGLEKVRAVILYPKGRVSPFQELQLTCWNAPVSAIEVDGDFDDCQRLVKIAFADAALVEEHRLSSANSINICRWLPQMAYHAQAAVRIFAETGFRPGLIIPAGNLGHGFAALYARAMGLPIGPILLPTNANRTLSAWAETGNYVPMPSVATIANAMDVGAPSNFERLISLDPALREVSVERVEDDAIRARIMTDFAAGYLWCPHSATGAETYARMSPEQQSERPWVVAATAHPYKFADVIEPLIGEPVEPSPSLRAILGREARKSSIAATPEALAAELEALRALV